MTINYAIGVICDLKKALNETLPPSKERDEIKIALTMAEKCMRYIILKNEELKICIEKQFREVKP